MDFDPRLAGVMGQQPPPLPDSTFFPQARAAGVAPPSPQAPQQVSQQQQGPDDFQVPQEELDYIATLQKKLKDKPAPRYTPEEVAQRKQLNDRDYALGMLGMASPNETLQNLGKQMYTEAIAARTPHITEHGSYDQLAGEFSYDPDYIQQKTEDQLGGAMGRIGQQRTAFQAARAAAADRAAQITQQGGIQSELARIRAENRPEQMVWAQDPNDPTKVTLQPKSAGLTQPPKGTGEPTGDELKAAGWVNQAYLAYGTMKDAMTKSRNASRPGMLEGIVGAFPGKTAQDAAYAVQAPQRQRFTSAVSSFSEAALRAATGAGVNHDEAVQKINELTPRWGEGEEAVADKEARLRMYLDSLLTRAGRAPSVMNPTGARLGAGAASAPRGTNFPGTRNASIDPNQPLPP